MFKRIAVVNRGEAAMRLINAVREVNAEGGDPIDATVARLAADPKDRAARERVAADMDAVTADWPE